MRPYDAPEFWNVIDALHELLINSRRKPAKQEKDLDSIRSVLRFINTNETQKERLHEILESLSASRKKRIQNTAESNNISLYLAL